MRRKEIFWGIALILIAVAIIVSKLALFPNIHIGTLVVTVILLALIVTSLIKLEFFGVFIPAAILCIMYDEKLGLTQLTPWPVLIAALLLSIGFTCIFKRGHVTVINHGDNMTMNMDRKNKGNHSYVEQDTPDGTHIKIATSFNAQTHYLNAVDLSYAKIENNFGSTNVYFSDVVLKNNNATVDVENAFGEINLFVPCSWRVSYNDHNAFGGNKYSNNFSTDANAPFIHFNISNSFGAVNINSI